MRNSYVIWKHVYTEVAGRVSFIVPLPRSRKTVVKSVLFQPLALVELEADFRHHVVYGITTTSTNTNYFNDLRGIGWEIELYYIVHSSYLIEFIAYHHLKKSHWKSC